MIPFKLINCEKISKDAKQLAARNLQQQYSDLEDEIRKTNGFVLVDFGNSRDLTWKLSLENVPKRINRQV